MPSIDKGWSFLGWDLIQGYNYNYCVEADYIHIGVNFSICVDSYNWHQFDFFCIINYINQPYWFYYKCNIDQQAN